MAVATAAKLYSVEEFFALPEHELYELVDGRLEELNVSNISSAVGVKIMSRLDVHVSEHDLGIVFSSESYYRCFPKRARNARKPDVSFIRKDRLPIDWFDQGMFTVAPDLAVEVISRHDTYVQVAGKTAEYIDAGVKLIWEVNPREWNILVHRLDGTISKLFENDTLSGEDVVPGFKCRVGDLFPARMTIEDDEDHD